MYISIVMPAYNAEGTIKDAIESVLHQYYTTWELIIIDDFSSDGTQTVAQEYCRRDKRIHYMRNEQNLGVAESRNRGVEQAAYDWIAYLDSDDMWTPDKLQKQVSLLNVKKNASLIYTGTAYMTAEGVHLETILKVPETVTYSELLKQNIISCSSVLVKKEKALSYKMQRDDLHEDFAAWLKILRAGNQACGINEPLLIYRLSDGSKSGNKWKAAIMNFKTYRYIGLNIIQSLYYMCFYIVRNLKKYAKLKG